MKGIILLTLAVSLAACGLAKTPAQRAAEEDAIDKSRCASMGVNSEDPRLMNCMLALKQIRAGGGNVQAANAATIESTMRTIQMMNQVGQPTTPTQPGFTCQRTGYQTQCW